MGSGPLVDDGHVPPPAHEDPWLGLEIAGRYTVEAELGWGSLGRVFSVIDRLSPDGAPLALKAVRRDRISKTSRALLIHEFRELRRLRHPHVVRAHRYDEFDGVPFFLLERVETETLVQAGQRLGPAETIELAAQALRALAYVHGRGLIHMDLKPQNLLVQSAERARPQLRLIDFHLAQRLDAPGDGTMRGTIAYMAPEVVRGRDVDPRADLYSLGAVVYEALCGHAPFAEASSPMDVLRGHAQRSPQRFHARGAEVSPDLEDWVRCLLEKRPNDRYPDAHEALRALGSAIGRSITSGEGPPLALETESTRQAYLERGELVEREAELRAAVSAAADLRDGRGGAVIALVGEEGIGKSRLLNDIEDALSLEGMVALHVRPEGLDGGGAGAALAELEVLLRRAGVEDLEQIAPRGRVDMDALASARSSAPPSLPALVRWASGLSALVRELGEALPLVVLVDEVERAAPPIRVALGDLLRAESPLLVILSARSREALNEALDVNEAQPGQLDVRELRRLTRPGASRFVGGLVGEPGASPSQALVERLWEVTGGNPRFLQQSLRELLEAGGLVDALGKPKARDEDAERVLPSASLGELTRARLERLSDDARELLAGLATSAQATTLRFGAAVAELTPGAARRALPELLRRGYVRPLASVQGPLALEHEPLRRAIEATCGEVKTRTLHARALRLLESRHPATWRGASGEAPSLATGEGLAADRSEELLWHAERAGELSAALSYAKQSAHAADREEDHPRARRHYTLALSLLGRLRESGDAPGDAHLPLTLALARCLAHTGERPRALELLAPLDQGFVRSGRGLRLRARLRKDAGDLQGALDDLERAEGFSREAADQGDDDDPGGVARCLAERASVLLWLGRYADARVVGEAALKGLEALLPTKHASSAELAPPDMTVCLPRPRAQPRAALAAGSEADVRNDLVAVQDVLYHACHFLGDGDAAAAYLQRGLETRQQSPPRTRQQDPPPQEVTATLRRALKRGRVPLLGDASGAQVPRSIVEAAFERADRSDDLLQLHLRRTHLLEAADDLDGAAYAQLNLAHVRRARGRLEEAHDRYEHAANLFQRTACNVGLALVAVSQARLLAQVGLEDAAQESAARGLELSQRTGARWIEAQAELARAEAALLATNLQEAHARWQAAAEHVRELHNEPQAAELALFRAELALAQGEPQVARAELDLHARAPECARSLTHRLRAAELEARLSLVRAGLDQETRLAEQLAAERALGEALSEAEARGLVELSWRLAWARAELRRARDWTVGELDDVISALSILRQITSPLSEEWRTRYLAEPRRAAVALRFQELRPAKPEDATG